MSIPARLIQRRCAACAVRAGVGALILTLAGPLEAGCQDRPRPGVDWTGCSRQLLMLGGDDLTGGRLRRGALRSTAFRKAQLSHARLDETELSFTRFEGADLAQADLTKVAGWKTNFTRANLEGADFSGADLSRAVFTEANLVRGVFRVRPKSHIERAMRRMRIITEAA